MMENEAIFDQKEILLKKKMIEIEGIKHKLIRIKQSIPYQLAQLSKKKPYSLIKYFIRNRQIKELSTQDQGTKNEPYHIKPLLPVLDNRPKVVHVIGNFITGGSSRLVADIIEHLGHFCEQEILTAYNPDPVSYTGIPIHTCYPLTSPQKVFEYLEKFQPDMMHVHYWGYGDKPWYKQAIQAGEKYGCKIIENVNTPVEPYWSDDISKYVYVSDYVKKKFGKDTAGELTIYPGSNFELFSRAQVRQIPDDCIGMVYRLEKDKLDEESINVFIEVAKLRPQTKMLIVGGGPFVELYSDAVKKAGVSSSFEFTGLVNYSRLPDLYRQMSIFVAPVVRESFGQVTPFAMSMGLPVAGYDVGALSEILGNKECLATAQDSTRLAQIIISLLDDRKKRIAIGQYNKERAQGKYSVEEMVRKYSILYNEMLGE
jgi:glycosyltransferase involved in cell wall biosynthesis